MLTTRRSWVKAGALLLALGGCGTTQAPAKGPENEPIAEEGPRKATTIPHEKMVEEATGPEQQKAKPDVSKSVEEAYDRAVEEGNKTVLQVAAPTDAACSRAARTFASLADQNPKLLSARYNEGLIYEKCGQPKDAEQAYRKALQANPRYANAIAGLGVLALKEGRT